MILNTLPKKIALAVLIAFGSVTWLNNWHQYVYSRGSVKFPPVSNWMRDSMIILIPITLVILLGLTLIERFGSRLSLASLSMLTATLLGALTALTTMLVETSKLVQTGIGTEFSFIASICSRLYPQGNLLISILKKIFTASESLRVHIMLQDGVNLALINLALIILAIMLIEGFSMLQISFNTQAPELSASR